MEENLARKYLDPKIVSQLEKLDLKARLVVEGFITGLHRSPYQGFSVEFAEHRQYMPGDPIRHIDWKVYGKTDRFYVRRFEEETNLKAYLLLDTSRSMQFASPGQITKLEYGKYLAASFSYLMMMQQDSVGVLLFSDRVGKYLPPRSTKTHLRTILRELEWTKASSTTNIAECLHLLAERIRRRGLIILISDLLDKPERVLTALKHFRHRKHEVVVFHILDPYELEFSYPEEAEFVDMETGRGITTHPLEIAQGYQARLKEWTNIYMRTCRENLIDYHLIDTSTPFDRALIGYLKKRKSLY
ncbi:MAG: DUF58 domain-containing protein [Candidatus Eisenbacteria bacterium]|nr:DUF58 domain-containing protein [Candidatus Eisenbacteria bacterium]